jgi:hypothetical protein
MKCSGLPASLLSLLAIVLPHATEVVGEDSAQDLGSVLAGHKDLSTYVGLVKVRPTPSSSLLRVG